MAVDMFLLLDGIKGESKDDKHKDEIEILSFHWGVSNAGTFGGGGGGSTGRASFQDFSFTADASKASPQLFLACASGDHIKSGVLTVRKAGEKPLDYYIIKLTDLLVSEYLQAGTAAGDAPMDEFSVNYGKIEIEYKSQNPDGSLGQSETATWDLRQVK